MEICYSMKVPEKEEFFALYETTGWNAAFGFDGDHLFKAIQNSWCFISAYEGDELVGTGRIVSDGFYQAFICDVIIHPEYQGRGIGKAITEKLMNYSRENGVVFLQLSCAKGKTGFYEKLGFKKRPEEAPGMQILMK